MNAGMPNLANPKPFPCISVHVTDSTDSSLWETLPLIHSRMHCKGLDVLSTRNATLGSRAVRTQVRTCRSASQSSYPGAYRLPHASPRTCTTWTCSGPSLHNAPYTLSSMTSLLKYGSRALLKWHTFTLVPGFAVWVSGSSWSADRRAHPLLHSTAPHQPTSLVRLSNDDTLSCLAAASSPR